MRYATGAALVLLAGAIWSVQGLIIRNIHEAGSWEILFWRSVGMVPVLLVWTGVQSGGRIWPEFRAVGVAGVIGGMGLVAAFSGAIFAFQATTVANAVLLFSASPFFAALLGWLILREQVSRATWGAIALAVVGVLMMVREGVAGGAIAGNIAALLSALGFAAFTITLRWGKLSNMLPAVVLGGLFSMAAGAAVVWYQGGSLAIPAVEIAISAGMGAVTLAGGMVLYTIGSRVIPAAQATLLSLVEVLLAPIWVWAFLGETATTATFVGGAVLLVAVVLNALIGARERAQSGLILT